MVSQLSHKLFVHIKMRCELQTLNYNLHDVGSVTAKVTTQFEVQYI